MITQPTKLNIQQLFTTPNEQFLIPSYQRRYAWSNKHYMALLEDIENLKNNDGHLFGMIIVNTGNHSGDFNIIEIVDGQQRITTLILLLKAFERVYQKYGDTNKINQVKGLITCASSSKSGMPKIKLGGADHNDMQEVLSKNNFETIANNNIKSCINDYIAKLSELDKNELDRIFNSLTGTAVIIRLDVSNAKDSYKLFEIINNRGQRLTPTDIIKNFLLGNAANSQNENTLEEVKQLWAQIIHNLDDLKSDEFLRYYMCSILNNKISFSKLIKEFTDYCYNNIEKIELTNKFGYYADKESLKEDDDDDDDDDNEKIEEDAQESKSKKNNKKITIIEFLKELVKLSKVYKELNFAEFSNPKIQRKIRGLNQIKSKPSYIFLMHFMNREDILDKEKLEVLGIIEALMLRRHICGEKTANNDLIFRRW